MSPQSSTKTYAYHQVLEIIRTIAWEDLGVEINGDTIQDLLRGVYAAGAADYAAGRVRR
jgi:hypothetical protein